MYTIPDAEDESQCAVEQTPSAALAFGERCMFLSSA